VGDRQAKDALFDAFAEVGRAIANGRRMELIDVLAQGERHVEQLADEIGQSVANTSFHLRTLAQAGLVTTRRDGTRVYYRLSSPRVEMLWSAMRDVAQVHLRDLDAIAAAYLGDRSNIEQITRDELARRLLDGGLIVIDVRPGSEYRAGHLPGAVSVPPDEVARLLEHLPAGADVVAYCRGPFCAFADEAVRALVAVGHRARRLEDGYPEWQRAGLATASGDDRGVVPL
jgi:rhodanese-related sulfurtransferase